MEPQERAGVADDRLTGRLAAPAALALLALFVLPARVTAMRGDDVFSAQLPGRLALEGESLAAHVWDGVTGGLGAGRPQPLGSVWGNGVIALLGDARVAYKLFLVAVTVGCAALLYALARRLGASRAVAALVVVLLAGAIQMRAYHDPLLGYYGTTQAALACVLGSLLLMLHGRRGWAVALFAAAVLLYEAMAPLAVVHLGVAAVERRWRDGLPFLAVAFAFVAYGFVVRTFLGGEAGGGYAVGYSPGAIVSTYLEQLVPPLPGSNVLLGDHGFFARPTAPELAGALWRAAAVAGAVLLAGRRRPRARVAPLAVAGALLLLSPVLLIAFAEKYQRELSPATGYLPVIAQSFGWALLAGALVVVAARRRAALVALALLLGAGAGLSGYGSLRVAAAEVPGAQAADALARAAGRGVLRDVPERATVIAVEADLGAGNTGWGERHALDALLRHRTGRAYDARHHPAAGIGTCDALPGSASPIDCGPIAARGAWLRTGLSREQAVVTSASFTGAAFGSPATRLLAYVEGGDAGLPALEAIAADGTAWSGAAKPWERVDGGDGWALYALTPFAPAPVADSIRWAGRAVDPAAPLPAPERVRQMGTARVLP